jgi:hypothetical protein
MHGSLMRETKSSHCTITEPFVSYPLFKIIAREFFLVQSLVLVERNLRL